MDNKALLLKLFTKNYEEVQIWESKEKVYDIPSIYAFSDKIPEPLQGEVDYIEIINDTIRELDYNLLDVFLFRKKFIQNFIDNWDLELTSDYSSV